MSDLVLPDGEVIDDTDADALIAAYEYADELDRTIYSRKNALRAAIGSLAKGDTKTRRVRGLSRRCKVTMPDNKLDQSRLKSAWNAYPQFRDEVLKIGVIDLKAREWSKRECESGPHDWMQFRKMISEAILPPVGLPKIEIEPGPSSELAKQSQVGDQEPVEELF